MCKLVSLLPRIFPGEEVLHVLSQSCLCVCVRVCVRVCVCVFEESLYQIFKCCTRTSMRTAELLQSNWTRIYLQHTQGGIYYCGYWLGHRFLVEKISPAVTVTVTVNKEFQARLIRCKLCMYVCNISITHRISAHLETFLNKVLNILLKMYAWVPWWGYAFSLRRIKLA